MFFYYVRPPSKSPNKFTEGETNICGFRIQDTVKHTTRISDVTPTSSECFDNIEATNKLCVVVVERRLGKEKKKTPHRRGFGGTDAQQ